MATPATYVDGRTLRWGALITALGGTIAYGWILGVVEYVTRLGNGFARTLGRGEQWILDYYSTAFALPGDVILYAWRLNADAIAPLGPLALPFAAIEIGVAAWLFVQATQALWSLSTGWI